MKRLLTTVGVVLCTIGNANAEPATALCTSGDGFNRTVYECSEREWQIEWHRRQAIEAVLSPALKREQQKLIESLNLSELDAWRCKHGLNILTRAREPEAETWKRKECHLES